MEATGTLIQLVQSESERLDQYLSSLPADAWSRPSACALWEVGDVVAHLIFWGELYAASIRQAIQGDISPLEGYPLAGSFTGQQLSEFNHETALTWRKNLGDRLLATFRSTNKRLNRVLVGLAPQDWNRPAYHPFRVLPVQSRVEAWVAELAFHGWDIRSELEPVAHLSQESLGVLSHWIGQRAVGYLRLDGFRLHQSLAKTVRYRFDLTDLSSGGYDLLVENDGCRMEPRGTTSPHVIFSLDAETFVLLGHRRLKLEAVIKDGRLMIEGDRSLAAAFREWFKRD